MTREAILAIRLDDAEFEEDRARDALRALREARTLLRDAKRDGAYVTHVLGSLRVVIATQAKYVRDCSRATKLAQKALLPKAYEAPIRQETAAARTKRAKQIFRERLEALLDERKSS